MLNPLDIIFGIAHKIKLAYQKWEANSLPLTALKMIIEIIKNKT